jgi:hypothetical protein
MFSSAQSIDVFMEDLMKKCRNQAEADAARRQGLRAPKLVNTWTPRGKAVHNPDDGHNAGADRTKAARPKREKKFWSPKAAQRRINAMFGGPPARPSDALPNE